MGRNLGPLNIKDSYEGLVQISGSQLTNGSGSLIPSLDVSASYATTAISASFATTSISASHAVNSNTAISASYAVTASYAENASSSTLQQVLDTGNNATGSIVLKNNEASLPALQINSPTGTSTTLLRLSRLVDDANNFVVTAGDASNATLSMGGSGGFGQINLNGTGTNKIQATTELTIETPSLTVTGALTSSGLIYPTVDGTVGQVVTTDGSGNLTLEDAGGGGAGEWQAGTAASSSVSVLNNTPSQIAATSPYSLLYSSGSAITSTNGWNVNLGGQDNQLGGGGFGAVIIGGLSNEITNDFLGSIIGGRRNDMQSYAGIIAGASDCTVDGGFHGFAIGANNSDVVGNVDNCGILGGDANTVSHSNSVVVGGNGLSTSKTNEVVVPALSTNAQVKGNVVVLTDSVGVTNMDCSLGNFFTLAMPSGGSTILTPSNITAGQTISVKITQNATPSTITFAATVDFEGGTAFAVSTSAGEVDVMTFISFDGTSLQATGLKNFS